MAIASAEHVTTREDLDRLAELANRLEEMCREAENLRDRVRDMAQQPPFWPERRRASRLPSARAEPGPPATPDSDD